MAKKTKKEIDREADAEFEAKTKDELLAEFAQSQALHVPAKKRESKLISIRLPMTMMKELRDLAVKRGDIGYQQLIKIYLAEAVRKEEVADRLAHQMKVFEVPAIPTFIWYSGESRSHWRATRYSEIEPPSSDVSANRMLELKERRG